MNILKNRYRWKKKVISRILSLHFTDKLSYSEIAKRITDKTGITCSRNAVAGIINRNRDRYS